MTSESATLFSNVDFPAADYSKVLTQVVFKQICLEKRSLKHCTVTNHLSGSHMILRSLLILEKTCRKVQESRTKHIQFSHLQHVGGDGGMTQVVNKYKRGPPAFV